MTAAKVACAAAGWELAPSAVAEASEPGEVAVWARASGFDVVVLADGEVEPTRLDFQGVDESTLKLAAVLAARGVRPLDVGPCLAGCWEAIGGGFVRAQSSGDEFHPQPCPDCCATGRHVVAIEAAVFMAAPRECDHDTGRNTIAGGSGPRLRSGSRCVDCASSGGTLLGHEGAREALRALGLSWTTLLYDFNYGDLRAEVLGDFVEANALPVDWSPLSAEGLPCPALPTWVGAWLDGACEECGSERVYHEGLCSGCEQTGLAIGPHLAAIGADLEQLWGRASVECPAECAEGDTWWYADKRVRACHRCGGLGRVRSGDNACALVAAS